MAHPMVVGQRWTDLPVPDLGAWEPRDRICVVLPARDNQQELDRTLAALAHQTYPAELMQVVVVDDGSHPHLTLPALAPPGVQLLRRDEVSSHGSGAARHAGASAAEADILLFLDSDMIADAHHVEAHARWHHVCDYALVLGHKSFVAVDDITPGAIAEASRDGQGLTALFADRPQRRHDWQEEQIAARDGLTADDDDAFLTVVGATVSVRRDFYRRTGGFSSFGLRGIVDTEFGYRAHARGAVIVPDLAARSWHQGARSFSSRGGEIKRARLGLAANHLPLPMFRPQAGGRQWAVPRVTVLVPLPSGAPDRSPTDKQMEMLLLTVDFVLASDLTDLAVTVVTDGAELPQWFVDYVAHEARVAIVDEAPTSGYPSPFTAVVPPSVLLGRGSLGQALELLADDVRLLRTLPDEYATPSVEVWRTRTLERLHAAGADPGDEAVGQRWCPPEALGIRRARPRITPQGMVASW